MAETLVLKPACSHTFKFDWTGQGVTIDAMEGPRDSRPLGALARPWWPPTVWIPSTAEKLSISTEQVDGRRSGCLRVRSWVQSLSLWRLAGSDFVFGFFRVLSPAGEPRATQGPRPEKGGTRRPVFPFGIGTKAENRTIQQTLSFLISRLPRFDFTRNHYNAQKRIQWLLLRLSLCRDALPPSRPPLDGSIGAPLYFPLPPRLDSGQ